MVQTNHFGRHLGTCARPGTRDRVSAPAIASASRARVTTRRKLSKRWASSSKPASATPDRLATELGRRWRPAASPSAASRRPRPLVAEAVQSHPAPVAQWTERLTSDQMVAGSNPAGRAKSRLGPRHAGLITILLRTRLAKRGGRGRRIAPRPGPSAAGPTGRWSSSSTTSRNPRPNRYRPNGRIRVDRPERRRPDPCRPDPCPARPSTIQRLGSTTVIPEMVGGWLIAMSAAGASARPMTRPTRRLTSTRPAAMNASISG